jgi:hypothetical protein
MKKRLLSIALCLCMVLSLLPAMAFAADTTGINLLGATSDRSGNGWTWVAKTGYSSANDISAENNSGTLTLFGVETSGAIQLPAGAILELVGYNKVTNQLIGKGDLTIQGSGVLKMSWGSTRNDLAVLTCYGTLTVKGGYIDISATDSAAVIIAKTKMLVTGGYIKATGQNTGIVYNRTYGSGDYEQTGGYVDITVTGNSANALYMENILISGGYLSTSGFVGIYYNSSFENSGGVIKTVRSGNGGLFTMTSGSTATFSGGVTVFSADSQKAIKFYLNAGSNTITTMNGEQMYDNTTAANSGSVVAGTTDATFKPGSQTSVVIAKAAYSTAQTGLTALDGVYCKVTDTSPTAADAVKLSGAVTVNGGSYMESGSIYNGTVTGDSVNALNITSSANISGTGTLVGVSAGNQGIAVDAVVPSTVSLIGVAGYAAIYAKANFANAIGVSQGKYGIFLWAQKDETIENGTLIGVTAKENNTGVSLTSFDTPAKRITLADSMNVTGYNSNTTAAASGFTTGVSLKNVVSNGSISGASVNGVGIRINSDALTISGGAVGAYGTTAATSGTISATVTEAQYATELSGTFGTTATDAKVAYYSVPKDPTITVGTQSAALTYSTAGTPTFAVTPKNFSETPSYSVNWYSDAAGTTAGTAPAGVTPSFSGNTLTMTTNAAANAGTYYFKVFSGETKSEVATLTITKATPNAPSAPTMNSKTDTTVTLNPVTVDGQTVEYAKNTTNSVPTAAGDWQTDTEFTELSAETTYYFFARVKESTNYKVSVASTGTPITTLKSMTGTTGANVTATYDGTSHGITVTGAPAGATIAYGTSEGAYNLTASPTYTDASTTPYTVYYKITADGYEDKTGAATVTVNAKEIGIGWSNTAFTYTGSAQKPTATATGLVSGDTCTVTVTGEQTDASATDYTATASALSNKNYKLPAAVTHSFSIGYATLTDVSVAQTGVLTHDDTAQTANVTKNATAVNNQAVTFTFSAEENGAYTAAVPSFTDAGTYTVYYKANAANHSEATGSFTVVIHKMNTVTFVADGETIATAPVRYGEAATAPTIPTKAGYDDVAPTWDKAFDNVTSDLTVTAVYTKNEPGEVKNTTPTDNAGGAALTNTPDQLKKLVPLTREEKDKIDLGEDVKIYLVVKDATGSVDSADKTKAEEILKDAQKLGMYLDISLFKQIGSSTAVKVPNTSGKITVTFKVPDNLLNSDAKVTRTYQIIRVHNGVATAINATYNAADHTVTFETDAFSTYALAYTDTTTSVQTGDSGNMALWMALLFVSGGALTAFGVTRKRKEYGEN